MEKKSKEESKESKEKKVECKDKKCPFHGKLKVRGKLFEGTVKKIVQNRAVVEFERLIYYRKYERYAKAKTRLHAYIPECLRKEINVSDKVVVGECRPLSKIIHFVVLKKLKEEK